MAGIPRWALRDRWVVEPYLGATGAGPKHGDPVSVRVHCEDAHQTRRSAQAGGSREVGDGGTAWAELAHAELITPEARVTWRGRQVEVTQVRRREFRGGPTPDHLEIKFM